MRERERGGGEVRFHNRVIFKWYREEKEKTQTKAVTLG